LGVQEPLPLKKKKQKVKLMDVIFFSYFGKKYDPLGSFKEKYETE